jgi:hypothetical protein
MGFPNLPDIPTGTVDDEVDPQRDGKKPNPYDVSVFEIDYLDDPTAADVDNAADYTEEVVTDADEDGVYLDCYSNGGLVRPSLSFLSPHSCRAVVY